MQVEVLFIAGCPHHKPAAELAREALRAVGLPMVVEEVEIRTTEEADAWNFLGSPTIRVNGLDVEPEARTVRHFGLGCRSYRQNGKASGLPSMELILLALQENAIAVTQFELRPRNSGVAESTMLGAGGLAAMLASACCLGPLLLVSLGLSGAWIGRLSVFEPCRPWFLGAAVIALAFAGRRIFRSADECKPGDTCALPGTRRTFKLLFAVVTVLVVISLAFPLLAPLFY
ncbi:MAG: mercuric ion transporter MerT [Acidobacteriaceae bacterium]